MKKLLIFILLASALNSYAQELTLNSLQAPSSPGANLLGISPSEIQKPIDSKMFAIQLQSATKNLTTIPKNFAFDVNLHSFLGGESESINKFIGSSSFNPKNILRSIVLSGAFRDDTIINKISKSQIALGLKFSLVRPKMDEKNYKYLQNSLQLISINEDKKNRSVYTPEDSILLSISKRLDALYNNKSEVIGVNPKLKKPKKLLAAMDTVTVDTLFYRQDFNFLSKGKIKSLDIYKKYDKDLMFPLFINLLNSIYDTTKRLNVLNQKINLVDLKSFVDGLLSSSKTETINKLYPEATEIANKITYKREGFYLDFVGGFVNDIPRSADYQSSISKTSIWLTGGWTTKYLNYLGILRYTNSSLIGFKDGRGKDSTATSSGIDFGTRLQYETLEGKLNLGVESLVRYYADLPNNSPASKTTWRTTFNIEYHFGDNYILSLVVGKDFDNAFIKSGNIVSFINLLTAFGSTKSSLKN